MNESVKQKIISMVSVRRTKGFVDNIQNSATEVLQEEELRFLANEAVNEVSNVVVEPSVQDTHLLLAGLRKDFSEVKMNIENILSKFKSKNPVAMKLLSDVSNHLEEFLKKIS